MDMDCQPWKEGIGMKNLKKTISLIAALSLAVTTAFGSAASAAVYDVTESAGAGLTVSEGGQAQEYLFPGDSVANAEVYMGMDNYSAGSSEGMGTLDDGVTPAWKNRSGKVYSVTVCTQEQSQEVVVPGGQVLDEAGNPVVDEAGNPVMNEDTVTTEPYTVSSYVLNTEGSVIDVINGSSECQDSSAVMSGYSVSGGVVYSGTDKNGGTISVPGDQVNAKAYRTGASVTLNPAPAPDGMVFDGWTAYSVDEYGSLNGMSGDQMAALGISADSLSAAAIAASGGLLRITVSGSSVHPVFVPSYAQAVPEAAPEEVSAEGTPSDGADAGQQPDQAASQEEVPAGADAAQSVQEEGSAVDGSLGTIVGEGYVEGTVVGEGYVDENSQETVVGEGYVEGNADQSAQIADVGLQAGGSEEGAQNSDAAAVSREEAQSSSGEENAGDQSIFDNANENAIQVVNAESNNVVPITDPETDAALASESYAIGLVDASVVTEGVDVSAVIPGTPVTVQAAQRDGLSFAGWTSENLELDDDQRISEQISFTMPRAEVRLVAQYSTENIEQNIPVQETPAENQTEAPAAPAAETQTEAPAASAAETQTEAPETPATEAQMVNVTAVNATIENVEATKNEDGSQTAQVKAGSTVTVSANEAPEGQKFSEWTLSAQEEVQTTDLSQDTINVTVGSSDVSLIALNAAAAYQATVSNADSSVSAVTLSVDDTEVAAGTGNIANGKTVKVTLTSSAASSVVSVAANTDGSSVAVTAGENNTYTFVMPADSVTITIAHANLASYLTLVQPAAGGTIAQTSVTGSAAVYTLTPSTGYSVSSFTAVYADDSTAVPGTSLSADGLTLTVPIPGKTVNVTAALAQNVYTLAVVGGSGSQTSGLHYGDTVTLTASTSETGKAFSSWNSSAGGTFGDAEAAQTTFVMPASNVTVTAVYVDSTYTLKVKSGEGDGTYTAGQSVVIKADAADKGYRFKKWTIKSGSGTFASATSSKTTFTTGAADTVLKANYELIPYTLVVENGTGDGSYTMGTEVDITPDFPASGKEFDYWEKTDGSISIEDKSQYYGSVTMKTSDAIVTAVYKDGPNPDNNKITGLDNGAEYLKSTTLSFTAAGAGMDNTAPNPGDYRYRPVSYQIGGVSGSWSSSPYTTSMAINAAGDYTLTVSYAKDVYDGGSWNPDGTTATKSVTFHVVNALSVETGDSSPLIPLAIAGIAALIVIIALVVVLKKRRNR